MSIAISKPTRSDPTTHSSNKPKPMVYLQCEKLQRTWNQGYAVNNIPDLKTYRAFPINCTPSFPAGSSHAQPTNIPKPLLRLHRKRDGAIKQAHADRIARRLRCLRSICGGEDDAVQPMSVFDDILGDIVGDIIHFRIPDLPLPRILPCPPAFPIKIPFVPCYNETKPVAECRSSLAKYMPPCAGFLTDADNGSASAPPKECCNAIRPFFDSHSQSAAPALCLCHVVNGDYGKLLKAPTNNTRADSFLQQCGLELTSAQVHRICTDTTTLHIPPMDAPSPPPTWRHH